MWGAAVAADVASGDGREADGGRAPLKIGIIEDRREIREGLVSLIDGADGFRCVGSFRSMEEALPRVPDDAPDVMLVDVGLPGMSGIDGLPLLRDRCPGARFLMLTVYDDDDRIFAALCAGADGYLLKKTPPDRLLGYLEDASRGGTPMSPEVARRVVELFRRFPPPREAAYDLTPHELRLLRMLAEGHNYRTAADELGVTVNTVAFHIKNIYSKMQVHSKSEAVARALRDGVIR